MSTPNETLRKALSHDLRAPILNLQAIASELRICKTEARDLLQAQAHCLPKEMSERLDSLLEDDMATLLALSDKSTQTALELIENLLDQITRRKSA